LENLLPWSLKPPCFHKVKNSSRSKIVVFSSSLLLAMKSWIFVVQKKFGILPFSHQQILLKTFSGKSSSKIPIVIEEDDLQEIFSRSSGPGGQSVNKTSSKVQLVHIPTGITISAQEHRDQQMNRKLARKKLKEQLDLLFNKDESKVAKKIAKVKKRKQKQRR
jgi:peptide chain release factor